MQPGPNPAPGDRVQTSSLDRAHWAFAQGDYLEALRFYTDSIAVEPLNDIAYTSRSAVFAEILDWISSREDAKRSLALNPLSARSRVQHVRACYMIGDFQTALMSASEGLASFPTSRALRKLSRLILSRLSTRDNPLDGESDSDDYAMDDDVSPVDELGPRSGNPYTKSPTVLVHNRSSPPPPPTPESCFD